MNIRFIGPMAAAAALAATAGASAQQGEGGRPFEIALTGAAERPNPGDPDGSGTAGLRINPGQGRICYTLAVEGIETATAAHIHRGSVDEAGPVVVPLEAPADGSSEGCAEVTRELAQEIVREPADFYVNVHNAPFPPGALRGQLARGGASDRR